MIAQKAPKALMVVATKQHVGKTSVCMALMSACRERFGVDNVGFIKPVGQRWVLTDCGEKIDKDANLARIHFNLPTAPRLMSPVVVAKGYTKEFIQQQRDGAAEWKCIEDSFKEITSQHDMTIVEGTGHVGVGSILQMSNAQVAARLKIPVIPGKQLLALVHSYYYIGTS
jgi:phosphate acetyltransferase